jgi:hypothetical protein
MGWVILSFFGWETSFNVRRFSVNKTEMMPS